MNYFRLLFLSIISLCSSTSFFGTCTATPLPEQSAPYTLWIIIHGTWAPETEDHQPSWYQPGGKFFDALEKGASLKPKSRVVPFRWSGGTRHGDRLRAAHQLKKVIQSYPINTQINIVGHSHGATVGILASKILATDLSNEHSISTLFTVGLPVDHIHSSPDYSVIDHVVNLFSFGDIHQPVFNWYNRELRVHKQCVNLRVTLNKKEPDHYGIHSEAFGYWIPCIMDLLIEDQHPFDTPRLLHVFDQEPTLPILELDYMRDILHTYDKRYHNRFRNRVNIFVSTINDNAPDLSFFSLNQLSFQNIQKAFGYCRRRITSATLFMVQKVHTYLLNSLRTQQNPPS